MKVWECDTAGAEAVLARLARFLGRPELRLVIAFFPKGRLAKVHFDPIFKNVREFIVRQFRNVIGNNLVSGVHVFGDVSFQSQNGSFLFPVP